jgi:hypothetical protein
MVWLVPAILSLSGIIYLSITKIDINTFASLETLPCIQTLEPEHNKAKFSKKKIILVRIPGLGPINKNSQI